MFFLTSITGVSAIITGLILISNSYQNRLYENTYINSIDVSGKDIQTSIKILEEHKEVLGSHKFTLSIDDISLASTSAELGYTTDFTMAVNDVFTKQHENNQVINKVNSLLAFFKKTQVTAPKSYDLEKLKNFMSLFNKKVELIGSNPVVELKVSGSPNSIVVDPGKPGRELNKISTSKTILEELQKENFNVTAKIASTSTVLSDEQIEQTIKRAEKFISKQVTVKAEDHKYYLDDKKLVSFINPIGEYFETLILEDINEWAEEIDRTPQNAIFEYDPDTLEVTEFVPDKEGLEVDVNQSSTLILNWLSSIEKENEVEDSIQLTLQKTKPEMSLDKTNDLGINERIGFGESYYYHSIPNRIHNVGITAERISKVIIPPGEEFSFNKTVGEVSSRTGYRSAYVISGGKTVLGDGGGVCQVSSTLFRSVLDAGLDVTKRLQHSYRVSYYELNSDPGFDATVYSGDVDFRFINDTPNYIMLLSYNNPEKLYMNIEIYGTNDGRVSEVHDYKKWGQVGPPASEYYPTSDLPTGVTRQVDWAVSGIKAEFTHTVKDKDGNIIHDDTYYSNYRPWSAKYMIGI